MAKYPLTHDQKERLDNTFTYHAPKDDQPERYTTIRAIAKELGIVIIENTPECREQELALVKLEEAIFYANASIARNE